MSAAARHYALEQSWDRIFEQLLDDYINILEKQHAHWLMAHG